MRTPVSLLVLAAACLAGGCDLGLGQREAKRTVVGVSPAQVLQASQRVMAAEGFDLAAVFPRTGNLRTAWQERPRVRLSYSVSTSPFVDEDGDVVPGALVVTVTCLAQDRLVGGWSEERASPHRTRAILSDITQILLELPPQPRRVIARPQAPTADASADGAARGPEPGEEEPPAADAGVDAGPADGEVTP